MRIVVMAAVAALFVGLAGSVRASGIDSEHLFGLTEGSDIGAAGEREIELEAAARFGKSSGTYRVLSQATALKLTLTDSFRVAPLVGDSPAASARRSRQALPSLRGAARAVRDGRICRDMHDSALAASAALSGRLSERVFVSGELRYERAYDGMGLDWFAGHGLFAGPAIYIKLSEQAWMSALWNAQIAGRASGEAGSLDLTNFERHLVKMRLGIAF